MLGVISMTELILDECIYSRRLVRQLAEKLGMKITYMGNGVPDNYIRSYVNGHDCFIVTGDRQLCYSLGAKALYLESKMKLKEIVRIVKIWLEGLA